MIDLTLLRRAVADRWVAVSPDGTVLDMQVPGDVGPAAMVVSNVTDAVKRVSDDRIVESVDRAKLWVLDALLLNEVVLDRVAGDEMELVGLIEAVAAAGFAWQISLNAAP